MLQTKILADNCCNMWLYEHKFLDPTRFSCATLDPNLPTYRDNLTQLAQQVRVMFHTVGRLSDSYWIFMPFHITYDFQSLT